MNSVIVELQYVLRVVPDCKACLTLLYAPKKVIGALQSGTTQAGRPSFDAAREVILSEGRSGAGPVIYWMQREMRAVDNWGLLHARARARDLGRTLLVAFVLAPAFAGAGERQYHFMLRGMKI